jgi:hypothetical protein
MVVTMVLFTPPESDPVYQNKKLSEHLETFRGGLLSGGGIQNGQLTLEPTAEFFGTDDQAMRAIDAMGTNALPLLVKLLRSKDSRISLWIRSFAYDHKAVGKWIKLPRSMAWPRRIGAIAAFDRLGPKASGAIPKIIPLLSHPDHAQAALFAITAIRPEREDELLSLTNIFRQHRRADDTPDSQLQYLLQADAILTLGKYGSKSHAALPFILERFTSRNHRVRAACAVAIARIGVSPEIAVPLIISNLSDPAFKDGSILMMNIWALEQYGPKARAALPILARLEGDDDTANVVEAARKARAKITAQE